MTVEGIRKAVADDEYGYRSFGIRADNLEYKAGEKANNSHRLFGDPQWDDDGTTLLYPYVKEGIYAGFYDAGELDGTCTVGFDPEDEKSIQRALDTVKMYSGKYIHVLGGYFSYPGEDEHEEVITGAEVLISEERETGE